LALLDLLEISKAYESQQILKNVDFFIEKGDRICIIGRNGGGKSTLLNIINGVLDFDEGRRIIQGNVKVEMLSQTPSFEIDMSVKEAIEEELSELKIVKLEYDYTLKKLEGDFENKELLKTLERLSNFLDIHDAWSLDDKVERVLQQFKLKQYKNRPVAMLSGGEQRRVTLAGLILKKPDILLLDEPTNHLDVYMVKYLEEMLIKESFTLVFISHDRYFIDKIATKTVEIDKCKLRVFKGGYQEYLSAKEALMASLEKSHSRLLRHLKSEEEWLRRGVKARLKRDEGRKKRVFEMRESAKKNPSSIHKMRLELEREQKNFNQEKSTNKQKMLFEMNDIHKKLGNKELISSFTARILQNDRIAIVGKNGAGKSTLLKILLEELQIDSGLFKKGEFNIGYFDQQRTLLDETKNIVEIFCPNGGERVDVKGQNMHVYGYLKNFLFPKEHLNKKIKLLSGGERNRVALALLFTKKIDCLILDEPTNDLDIPTINILEEYVQSFQGAVVFVSHDRYFVDKIAKKLYIFKGEGKIQESYQSYSEYLEMENEIRELESFACNNKKTKYKTTTNRALKLSYKEKQDYEILPIKIEEIEGEIKEIKECLQSPKCYQEIGLTKLSQKLELKEAELEPLIEIFLKLEEKIELID